MYSSKNQGRMEFNNLCMALQTATEEKWDSYVCLAFWPADEIFSGVRAMDSTTSTNDSGEPGSIWAKPQPFEPGRQRRDTMKTK